MFTYHFPPHKRFVFIVIMSLAFFTAKAQITPFDSTYYQSYASKITARLFLSQKYTHLELEKNEDVPRLRYLPNTTLNMGMGVTYQSITINLGYGFGFLNTDKEKGKTRYIDLQSHLYGRKWTVDLFGQFYKGYYLFPKGNAMANENNYYIRPDISINLIGVAAYRIFNYSRFSYRAAFVQNEKQKKSAGSFLAGAEIYYGVIAADSSLVPQVLSDIYPQQGVRTLRFIKIGPGVGYAYTFVMGKAFFVTGSATGNINFNYTRQKGTVNTVDKISINPGYIYRFVLGYDKNHWNVNFSIVGNQLKLKAASSADRYYITAGNYRITLAKRLNPGPKLSKKLRPLDKLLLKK